MASEQGATEPHEDDGANPEPRFDTLARSSSQGIVVHRDFKALFANDALATMFGFERAEDIVALPSLEVLFTPEVYAWLRDLSAARLRGEQVPSVYELEGRRRDGKVLIMQALISAVSWQGQPAIMAHVIDISERKHRERVAQDRERLLHAVVSNSPVILWSIDAGGAITLSEGRGLGAQGLETGEAVGRSIFDVYADNPEFLANVRRALAGDAFTAINETRGAIFERVFEPIRNEAGEVTGVTGVSVDITRSARAESRARESEQLLRSIVDALPHFVFLKDATLHYRMVNESFARYHGMSVEQMTGLHHDTLPRRTQSNRDLFAQDDRRVLDHGETVRRSGYKDETPDGELGDFEALKLPLRDDSGKVVGVVGLVDDVTEALSTQRELERHREHLEELVDARTSALVSAQEGLMRAERLATIGQLTATVSHELRNPLGTIRTSFEALRPGIDVGADERSRRAVERIERSIDRCVAIIEELLDYTRTRTLALTTVELDTWLPKTLADVETPPGTELLVRPASGATVRVDTERVRQALVNLTQNAFQSLAESTARGARRTVSITAERQGGRAAIHVHDSGPGVAPEMRERIFEPLFSTRAFGVGLGLPLVRAIAEEHDGEVVYGAPGAPGGSTFTLRLPLAGAPPR